MPYDSQLASAELDRLIILVKHHLRRQKIESDYPSAKEFYSKLGALKEEAGRTMVSIRRDIEKGC